MKRVLTLLLSLCLCVSCAGAEESVQKQYMDMFTQAGIIAQTHLAGTLATDGYTAEADLTVMQTESLGALAVGTVVLTGLPVGTGKPSGVADAETLAALSALTGGMLDGIEGPLSLTSGSEDVLALQKALTKAGYYTFNHTGHYGANTQAAVAAFQKAKGIGGASGASVPEYSLALADRTGVVRNLDGAVEQSGDTYTIQLCVELSEDMSWLLFSDDLPEEWRSFILLPNDLSQAEVLPLYEETAKE